MAERNRLRAGDKVIHLKTGVTGTYKGMTGKKPQMAAVLEMDIEFRKKYAAQINGTVDECCALLALKKDLTVLK